MSFTIVPLSTIVPGDVEALLDRAFGADRHARTAYRLRAGVEAIAALSFAALDGDGRLAGTVQCWPVRLDADAAGSEADAGADGRPMVLVGPVAVEPGLQGGGIGQALMSRALAAADGGQARGSDLLMLIGDPDYYRRFFGFSAACTGGWALPGPVKRHRLLARARAGVRIPARGRVGPDAA